MKTNNNYFSGQYFLILAFISLIVGFYFGENSSGGAYIDYVNQKKISLEFAKNFSESFHNYEKFGTTRHSPVVPILISLLEKLSLKDYFIRIFYLVLCLTLPIFFYKCLNLKFKGNLKNTNFFLTGLIFLSPTFRSLSIWPDSRILGLSIFTFAIFFYLKFLENKKIKNAILNIFCISLASYVSPNFSIFSIFFLYKFFKYYGFKKEIVYFIFLNIFLAYPAFHYIFLENHNFLFTAKAISPDKTSSSMFNYFNKILIIESLFLFYLLPFLLTKTILIKLKKDKKIILISLIVTILCALNFDYPYSISGGGFFLKLSGFIFNNFYFFYIISFISIFLTIKIFKNFFENYLIFFILIASNPQLSIYHKYYEPLFYIIILLLFRFDLKYEMLKNNKNQIIFFLFFLFFLLINLFKKNFG